MNDLIVTLTKPIFILVKLITIVFFILLTGFACPVLAQQNFTPLKPGDYKVVQEDNRYLPGAKISGQYRAYYDSHRSGFLVGKDSDGKIQQDIFLDFQSKINTNVSLNVRIENKSSFSTEQETSFETKDINEKGDSTGDEGLELVFGKAYLEYNHNPNARLRIGTQELNIADGRGLIYQGTATAISQDCRVGTWCYGIGGARIGKSGGQAVFWAQLDYPIYESGVLIKDPWGKELPRQEISFNIEIFRVNYRGKDIPLAEYGGWTGENSIYHDTTDDSASGQRVYFDNDGIEYIGFNIRWNFHQFILDLTWSNLTGSRVYHTGTQDGDFAEIGDQTVSGNAYYLEMKYLFSEKWRGRFHSLLATGNGDQAAGEEIWQKKSSAYFEIKKGNFGDAIVYFNGEDNIGDGHSVSNLTFYALGADYLLYEGDVHINTTYYMFKHTNPVLINQVGSNPVEKTVIGNELDLVIVWALEDRLDLSLFIGYFQPGEAYATNDNLPILEDQDEFTILGLELIYRF